MSKHCLMSDETPGSGERAGRLRRILFVAEALTLAQVVRLVALAQSLDRARVVLCDLPRSPAHSPKVILARFRAGNAAGVVSSAMRTE